MSEPIAHCGELHEAEERRGEPFVARAKTAVAFDATKEIFDLVAAPIVAAMERDGPAARAVRRNTDACALPAQARTKRIGIEALVGHDVATTHTWQRRFDRMQIIALASGQAGRHGMAMTVDDGRRLRVDATVGAADGLRGLPAARIRAVLMRLDMRTVDVAQFALGTCGCESEHTAGQSGRTSAAETRVDRTPRAKVRRQVTPMESRCEIHRGSR